MREEELIVTLRNEGSPAEAASPVMRGADMPARATTEGRTLPEKRVATRVDSLGEAW